ncbi:MAG: extracellular solute-binding protein [Hyphomicrobiaceae bacterium]|nr:extracellular solute-binding protein [Hyphomicrobiaceae bacterium]
MMATRPSRRKFVAGSVAAAAAGVASPHIRTARAAGSLSLGLWDHWVPGANDACTRLVNEWAEKEKVEVKIDYITGQGNKLLLTIAAEAQAKSGHDVIMMSNWLPIEHGDLLEPVDDVMAGLFKEHGAVYPAVESYGKSEGKWVGVPSIRGTLAYCCATRLDLLKQHAGIDVVAMYPPSATPNKALADGWTYDAFLRAAEACHKAGVPFGLPMGSTADSVQWVGSMFTAFGAVLVDAKGKITVKSPEVREVLEYAKRLMEFLPPEVPSWDDASNNKWLVSGKGALIMNPASAWAVAKRDAPEIARQIWHHPLPKGPKGRFIAATTYYLAIWKFSKNKSAAKSLIAHLSTRAAAERLITASNGYDLPSFDSMNNFTVWDEQEPPKGTNSHYPNKPGGDQQFALAAAPAPAGIAAQIYSQAIMPKMILRHRQGEAIDKTLDWAAKELEGFSR